MFFLIFLFLVNHANAQHLQHDSELLLRKECTVSFFVPDTSEFYEIRGFNESNDSLYELKFIPWSEKLIFTFSKMEDYNFLLELKYFNSEISMIKTKLRQS